MELCRTFIMIVPLGRIAIKFIEAHHLNPDAVKSVFSLSNILFFFSTF